MAKPVIGIIGGVGSGKSTVAAELARLGCALIDADRIGHALLGEADVRDELLRRWGRDIFDADGRVDRKALASIVFADADELAALNEVLHPRIRRRMEDSIARARAGSSVRAVVVDAAVLIEAGWNDLCTHLVFVDCPARDRASRVRLSRGWDESTWRARENSQDSLDRKSRMCDYTISNSSGEPLLVEQIRKLLDDVVVASDRP